MTKRAFTFPGQGGHAVGMGRELAENYREAGAVFDEVDDALETKLSQIIFEGPEEILRLTENAQPALMAVSMAIVRVLETKGIRIADTADYVAGHSLGEYSALCAAGALSLADTARLLQIRGRAMQQAVPVGEGAMAAILGLDLADVADVAKTASKGGVCDVANDNAPGQIVLSGSASCIDHAVDLARETGAKRAVLLPVSAPFHCELMEPAAEIMEDALASADMTAPVVPLVSNVLATPISDPDEIKRCLVEQVCGRVRWVESIRWLADHGGVTEFAELGTGTVLSGLVRRIDRNVKAIPLNTAAAIDALGAALQP